MSENFSFITSKLRVVRRSGSAAGTDFDAQGNESNELLVAQGMPPYFELTRRFDLIKAMNTAALAALVVRPSTLANFTIFNNESGPTGKYYLMHRIFAFNLVSTAAQAKQGMWCCVHKTGLVSPTNDITARGSGLGNPQVATKSIADTNMTVVDDGWFPVGNWSDVEPTGVLPGAIMEFKFDGTAIVPPQQGISGQVVSGVVGNTFTMGFEWWEIPPQYITLG